MTKKKAVGQYPGEVPEAQTAAVKTSLFDLTSQYIDLMNLLETSEGEITAEQEKALDAVGGAIPEKVDNYYRLRALLVRRETGLGDEIKHLQARKKVTANAIDRLDRLMQLTLERLATTTLNGNTHAVGIVSVGGKRSVEIKADGDALPDELVTVTVTRTPSRDWFATALATAEVDTTLTSVASDSGYALDVMRLGDGTIHLVESTPVGAVTPGGTEPTMEFQIVATLKPRGERLAWS